MSKGKENKVTNLSADIVVLGGGGAGLAAAIAARENGAKKVILLEKTKSTGGNSELVEGIYAVESPMQRRMGIDASLDRAFVEAMEVSSWKINPHIIRAFLDKSGDTIGWLEKMGLIFDRIRPLYPTQYPLVWHSSGPRLGYPLIKTLTKGADAKGVQILYKTAGKKLLTDSKGNVTGVLAETIDGEFNIKAKAVIIATGGYGGNKEMLKKYYPFYSDTLFPRGHGFNGDGLRMAINMGADTESLGVLILCGPYFPWSWPVSTFALRPETIWLNKSGERYINEATAYFPMKGNAIDRQPGKVSYCLFDNAIKKSVVKGGSNFLEDLVAAKTIEALSEPWLKNIDKSLEEQISKGRVIKSNSLEEIAKWIGAKPAALKATVSEYNSFCDHGNDSLFFKDSRFLSAIRKPPYYAVKCYRGFDNTVGGIKINHHMEVISLKDTIIPGLFAAGSDTGGWEADTYNCRMSGTSIGFAVSSGRIAGESAAKYAARK
jgi:fumarate reductase flavoprotein subunit